MLVSSSARNSLRRDAVVRRYEPIVPHRSNEEASAEPWKSAAVDDVPALERGLVSTSQPILLRLGRGLSVGFQHPRHLLPYLNG